MLCGGFGEADGGSGKPRRPVSEVVEAGEGGDTGGDTARLGWFWRIKLASNHRHAMGEGGRDRHQEI